MTLRKRESPDRTVVSQFSLSPQDGKRHAYFVMDIDELPGWRATLRLDDVDGTPVVTEIRVFANHVETWIDKKTSSATLDLKPSEAFPESGLTSTLLRKVPVERLVKRGLSQISETFLERPWIKWLSTDRSRVGKSGRGDRFYAEWAAAYTALVNSEEPKPIVRLNKEKNLSQSQIRTILGEARSRGLLTRAPRGRAGGSLTSRAESILSQTQDSEEK